MTVRMLSAGAAKGLAGDVQAVFEASSGVTISGSFSAVGTIRERFESGEGGDVLILTARQLAELEAAGSVRAVVSIGTVRTAIAVPGGGQTRRLDGSGVRTICQGSMPPR